MTTQVDISIYEKDEVVVALAKQNKEEDLKVLLKDDHNLSGSKLIRVARLMIKKYYKSMLEKRVLCVSCKDILGWKFATLFLVSNKIVKNIHKILFCFVLNIQYNKKNME